ncbi:TonB-dependent receptor [Sphingomonas sp. MMS24-J13]|uniref:TonB-dependent receptor n=1 Tax=Sphingomonas sp. MMS24-J13 TaxID=3238686 RepID=UPI00384B7099
MRGSKPFSLLLFSSTMLTVPMSGVAAQQAAPPAAGDAPAYNNEIIVTATKRSESLQNVPISVQALTSATLDQHQVASFDDIAKLLPSVSYQSFGPGQAQLYFRGIATGGDGLAAGPLPGSGLYIDETPVTTIFSSVDLHAYDLARVEALSGPQGTLYGASSLSGTLRIITNKPDPSKFSAGYDLQGNKFGKGGYGGQAEGFVNLPLNETMAIRLVGYYNHDGGYIDNTPGSRTYERPHTVGTDTDGNPIIADAPMTVNNASLVKKDYNTVDDYGGRAALLIDLDDHWTITPGIIYQHMKAKGEFLYDPRAGDLQNHDFTPSKDVDKWYIASLTAQGKISDWDLTYSGSYFHRTVENVADYSYFTVAYDTYPDYNYLVDKNGKNIDPTQTIRGYDKYSKMAHELRISSNAQNRLRVTAGLFYQRQVDDRIAEYIIPGVSTAVNPFSPPVPGAGADDVYYTNIHRVDRDYAAFGEASFDILPNLTLTGGIRGFKAHNTLNGFSGGAGAVDRQISVFGCTGTTAQACPNIDKSYKESGETHRVNLSWKVMPSKMVYFTYSTGFRPGGNNRDAFALNKLQVIPPFKADTLTNYEVGWKTSWFDHTLRLNGALFWEDWNNVQYSLPGILGIFYTVNAGAARSRGAEADISWTIAHALTLSGSGTYVDPRLTQAFCDQVNGCDPANGGQVFAPKGTRLPVTPHFKINATARYDFMLGENKAFLQGGVNHQSGTTSYLSTSGEDAIGPTNGFTTFDFSAGIKWHGLSFEAFIQNAFDKRGILSKNIVCAPNLCGQYARLYPVKPQLFGLKVGQRF